jgi:lysozyme
LTSYSEIEADLRRDEGVVDKPYRDSVGKLTIGIGHNLDAEGLCAAAIAAQFDYDLKTKAIDPLDAEYPWWREEPPAVQRVLLNLMFNMGPSTLRQFKNGTLRAIKEHRYRDAAKSLLKTRYAKQVGQRAFRLAKLLESVL